MNSSKLRHSKQQFNTIFRRLVSFSSATMQNKPHDLCSNLSKTVGINDEKIFSGKPSKDSLSDKMPTFEKIRSMPNNATKTLFMNLDQLAILAKRLVVFLSDYGTGNYM